MDSLYKPPFKKFVKKQSRAFQLAIEDEVEGVINNPDAGEAKKGDLSGLRVHKFKFQRQEYLIAYKTEGHTIVFYMIGTHENFYRELKQYLREV
ncbi:MAG: type II toxin-antitoxin system RelE/ParE family toxin [Nitrospiraceae bacterium]|nr:MAG: type II toxin-antitoxin system RelE/ParE family toxin [Nitrospiraceae bacterium]